MKIATYLLFNGTCEEALRTYQQLFNAEVICMHKSSAQMVDDEALVGKVFHAELNVNGFYLYMSDAVEHFDYGRQAYKVTVECDTLEQAQLYHDTLSKEGVVIQPFGQTPYGMFLGQLRDRFGITWDFVYCR